MFIHNEIRKNLSLFSDICKNHGIKSLYAFGSSVTEQLVEMEDMDPLEKGEKLLSLWDKLEDFFQRKVDLLTQKSLKNPFLLENIDKTKILLYDNERKEVFV